MDATSAMKVPHVLNVYATMGFELFDRSTETEELLQGLNKP